MLKQIVDIADRRFLKLQLLPVMQKGCRFFLGKVPARHFLYLYTVEPAAYDADKQAALASEFQDDKEYHEFIIKQDEQRIDTQAFNRKESKTRVSAISQFLNEEPLALFPNSVIVTCELLNDYADLDDSAVFDASMVEAIGLNGNLSFLEENEDSAYLYIPYEKKSVLIIDGQHRVKGLEAAGDEVIDNYELVVSFIIGYDRSAVAKLFYTINYTQKSVSKSLLYHLTGEFSQELDEITFMHGVVKILNELDHSPFYKRIKMLGTIPEDVSRDDRKLMTISQAFLIDYLKNTITGTSLRSIHAPIFLYYFINEELQIEIARFLIRYFNAIKEIYTDAWNDPDASILSKTVSVGAFIRLLHFLFVKMFIDEFDMKPDRITGIRTEDLIKRLDGIQEVDFSRQGEFGGVSSAGTLNKLKKTLVENVVYFDAEDYSAWLESYKGVYLPRFRSWLNKYA